ncbi:unnamed protein product [Ectocarpus fasciculatus]
MRGKAGALKMAAAAIGDMLRGLLGMQARYVALVGSREKVALMQLSEDEHDNYFAKVCARVGAMVGMYSPIKALPKVRAPILCIAAEHDQLCPVGTVREAAEQAINTKLSIHDKTHSNIYLGGTL